MQNDTPADAAGDAPRRNTRPRRSRRHPAMQIQRNYSACIRSWYAGRRQLLCTDEELALLETALDQILPTLADDAAAQGRALRARITAKRKPSAPPLVPGPAYPVKIEGPGFLILDDPAHAEDTIPF